MLHRSSYLGYSIPKNVKNHRSSFLGYMSVLNILLVLKVSLLFNSEISVIGIIIRVTKTEDFLYRGVNFIAEDATKLQNETLASLVQ